MSVDTFYYCTNIELVHSWWEGPYEDTISSLSNLMSKGRDEHPWLLSNDHIINVFIPGLFVLQNDHPEIDSLAEYCQTAVDKHLAAGYPSNTEKSIFKRIISKKTSDKEFDQLKMIVDDYKSLLEIAWKGPIQQFVYDTRFVDDYFSEFLACYLPQEEAIQYNGADTRNVGTPCLPRECLSLPREANNKLQLYTQPGNFIDPSLWLSRWEKLDSIPSLWSDLESELGDREPVEFLQQIKEIATYTNQHKLSMVKVYW